MNKTAIILGTSRANGNTHQLAIEIEKSIGAKIYNLQNYNISAFDYAHKNKGDDFIALITQLIDCEHIIFASPVYWYSPSSQLKVFMDRMSDLVTTEKELGRKLRNKYGSFIATGDDIEIPSCFADIFDRTFDYLGMHRIDQLYCSCQPDFNVSNHVKKIESYIQSIKLIMAN